MHGNQWVLKIAVLKYYSVSKRGTTAKSNPKQATDPISLHTKFGDNSSNTFPLNERKPCVTPDIGRRTPDIGHRTAKKAKIIYPPPRGVDIMITLLINSTCCDELYICFLKSLLTDTHTYISIYGELSRGRSSIRDKIVVFYSILLCLGMYFRVKVDYLLKTMHELLFIMAHSGSLFCHLMYTCILITHISSPYRHSSIHPQKRLHSVNGAELDKTSWYFTIYFILWFF